jgi:hypothetical protein
MDMYDSLFSPSCVLNEQIARQMFEILPEGGPIMAIFDRSGHIWPSDSERWAKLQISESFLGDLANTIDDGAEPVITGMGDCGVVGIQLATEKTNCGYAVVALEQYSPESILINIGLLETLFGQLSLIGRLIEKNSQLYELQMKHFSAQGEREMSSN